jgi:hypothetical protein
MVRHGGGALKGPGWLGNIPMTGEHEGYVMSELSVGHPDKPGGLYPLIVPGMDPNTVARLAGGGEAWPEDYRAAEKSRDERLSKGLSPFRSHKEPMGKMKDLSFTGPGADDPLPPYYPGPDEGLPAHMGIASDDYTQAEARTLIREKQIGPASSRKDRQRLKDYLER